MGQTLITDLQILDCELHKKAFGGRTPPAPELYSAPAEPLAVIRKEEGGEGKERVGNSIEGRKGTE